MPVPGLASLSLGAGSGGGSGGSSPRARTESEGSSSSSSGDSSGGGGGVRQQEQEEERPRQPRRPPRPVRHATTTHRTVPLHAIRPPAVAGPPSLVELTLAAIADHCAGLVDIQGLDEALAVRLLGLVLQRGKLDYRLCQVGGVWAGRLRIIMLYGLGHKRALWDPSIPQRTHKFVHTP